MNKALQIVMPMAGRGDRFAQSGLGDVKPLIKIDGRSMFEHVLDMVPGERDILFICARDHLQTSPLRKELKRVAPYATIAGIEPHKRGPLHSTLSARHLIRDEDPVLLIYCDSAVEWDYSAFLGFLRDSKCDACAPSHRGFHPLTLGPNVFGFLRVEGDKFKEIRARKRFQVDPMSEVAAVGIYYFRTGLLMKEYLEKTDKGGISLDGEYFPAFALNLMANDGLDVRHFPVERFVQWETPEDIRVYERWSHHFAKHAEWRAKNRLAGSTLFPMAGEGSRFTDAGFFEPKPSILADGEPILARAVRSLPRTSAAVAILTKSIDAWSELDAALASGDRITERVVVTQTTTGEATSCLLAKKIVQADKPLLIAPCDAAPVFDERAWNAMVADTGNDFLVWTFQDHPHANRNPLQYSWVTADARGVLTKLSLRKGISADTWKDTGMCGIFWFRNASDFFAAAETLIAREQKIDNEYLVEAVLPLLLAAGKTGRIFPVIQFLSFGTPDELRTYAYWAAFFRGRALEQTRKAG